MDEIRDVVDKVVRGCAKCGVEIDDVLAAFVARTIVESNDSVFALDKKVTIANTEEIILQAIEKLIERDNPSLETMKMQVDYDSSFLKHDADAQKSLRLREKMLASHKLAIVEVLMEDANDFEALTVLYRKIFRFLLDFAPNAKGQDRQVEREVAAALESVFPRVGLKTFAQLSYDEKNSQLAELAKIVLGIRLFNRDQNRGGAGIDNMDKEGSQLASSMLEDVNNEVEFFSDACTKYQIAIVRAQLLRRRDDILMEKKIAESKADSPIKKKNEKQSNLIPIKLVERWLKELANRRQYLGFLRLLQDEMKSLQVRVTQICENLKEELVTVQQMVTNRASVSKELVYPRFDSIGALWVSLFEEVNVLLARSSTFGALCVYRLSFTPTLDEKYYTSLTSQNSVGVDQEEELPIGGLSLSDVDWGSEAKSPPQPIRIRPYDDRDDRSEVNDSNIDWIDDVSEKGETEAMSQATVSFSVTVDGMTVPESTAAGATLLSVHNTPDFLLLPLEMQGYCPWSMVHAHGLLLPGKPALGVIRYENMYYVCEHVKAIKAFMEAPEYYLKNIRARALASPEYIHLLRLQRLFPSASIAKLLERDDSESSSSHGRPTSKDASTGTPTHFIESNIDISYHWNEWELRRRALKIVNLTNCVTASQQTDNSHFRRDNSAQVYVLRDKDTQTKRDKGTNPPITTTYIAGLRGKAVLDCTAVSKYVRKESKDSGESKGGRDSKECKGEERLKARVVTLQLDL